MNDFRDGHDDKEARVTRLGSNSEDSFITASEGLKERDFSVLDCTAPFEGKKEANGLESGGCMWRELRSK